MALRGLGFAMACVAKQLDPMKARLQQLCDQRGAECRADLILGKLYRGNANLAKVFETCNPSNSFNPGIGKGAGASTTAKLSGLMLNYCHASNAELLCGAGATLGKYAVLHHAATRIPPIGGALDLRRVFG